MIGLLPIVPLLSFLMPPAISSEMRGAANATHDIATGDGGAAREVVTSPRVAQVRLAETLAEADAIESVSAHGRAITFVVVRGGDTFDVTAQTKKSGEIVSLAIAPAANPLPVSLHGLTWLGPEMAEATAVTRLVVDADGGIMIRTSDDRRYMAIPGRGSGGANVAAEARWAAEWSADGS